MRQAGEAHAASATDFTKRFQPSSVAADGNVVCHFAISPARCVTRHAQELVIGHIPFGFDPSLFDKLLKRDAKNQMRLLAVKNRQSLRAPGPDRLRRDAQGISRLQIGVVSVDLDPARLNAPGHQPGPPLSGSARLASAQAFRSAPQ